ncbi:MAG TPA: DUF177 domain-containing protein [Thermodesulfobacteriaceae bacterium]|nr:DUF177 domain-containing protein [Thermodesulfobacteriaceae bacterium]
MEFMTIKNITGYRKNVTVDEIPAGGLAVHFDEPLNILTDVDDCTIRGKVKGDITLYRINHDETHLSGRINAVVILQCHRCLDAYEKEVETDFTYLLKPELPVAEGELALSSEDLETADYDGNEIEIGEKLREQILLQLPIRNLCKDNCRGLCPGCGANLGKEECRCRTDQVDSPFAVLKDLNVQSC